MPYTYQNGYAESEAAYESEAFAETPFTDAPAREAFEGEWEAESSEFTTPFLPGESYEAGEAEAEAPALEAFTEIYTELEDPLFREALEQLADEALEAHAERLAGEYGDRETQGARAAEMLHEHLRPLAVQADMMLDRFMERLEAYEAESLTDVEIGRIANEVMPSSAMLSPAYEQFLGGLIRKAKKLVSGAVDLAKRGVSGAVKLAGKGLAAIGKFALGPLLAPLKKLGVYLLRHVVRFALGQLPPALRPLGQTLSDKLFRALGETEQTEAGEALEGEHLPATLDAAQLETEFDVQAAQLLFTENEAETEHLVESYGEAETEGALEALDDARGRFTRELERLSEGESAQPVMEQFVPALLWPAAKTAITILGRPKLVAFLGKLLGGLVKPLIGAKAGDLIAPAIADAGLRIFGLEAEQAEPRAALAEALAATVEETLNHVAALPEHVLENETLLSDAVHEAFETAAASYFPNSAIKPELRESGERHGQWARLPGKSSRKRYGKYSDALPVEISARLAGAVPSFGRATLRDALDNDGAFPKGQNHKSKLTLYQALPGTRAGDIARAEGFPASQLHPLTPQAAGALLGPNAAMGMRPTPDIYLGSPGRLHVGQRLYRIEPRTARRHTVRPVHGELALNLRRGEIRIWLYLSEPVCQHLAGLLGRGGQAAAAFGRVRPLLHRTTELLRAAAMHRHLPPGLLVAGARPNFSGRTPHWLRQTGSRLAAKVGAWAQMQLAQYFRNGGAEFRAACASQHDGVTLRITMTHVPGMHALRMLAAGRLAPELAAHGWPAGDPKFQVAQRPGPVLHRLRD